MEIKVLGTGCAGCRTLYETVTQAIAELGISAAIVKEEDIAEILSYGIMTLPGLVVDGRWFRPDASFHSQRSKSY